MIQRQLPIYRQMSARDSVMPHIAHPNDNGLQPDRGEHDRLDRAFDVALGERSATERSARAAQRLAALGEMTGGIVHDFRNLLAVIESGLRLAEKNSEQSDKVHVYIAAAREAIDRGLKLTSQLLAFAKQDAMPNGGEIRISTERWVAETAISGSAAPGIYVRVRVKDSGQGMPAEVVRKVFDPFFTTKGEKGTGLGLPHVYAFMRLIGGHVGALLASGGSARPSISCSPQSSQTGPSRYPR